MIDEQRNVVAIDTAPVLRTDFDGAVVCHDIFSPVSRDMIIDAKLQRLEQRGFPMISSADDQRDAPSDSHAADRPAMRKLQRDPVLLRRAERQRILHRFLRDAALPRQNRSVRDKSAEEPFLKLRPEKCLILRQIKNALHRPALPRRRTGCLPHHIRQEAEQHLFQFSCQHRPPGCREARVKAKRHAARPVKLAGAPVENLLPRPARDHRPAFP